jgi:hypothetical protein
MLPAMAKRLHPAVREYVQKIGGAGGKKGGPARARALSPARRSEIAKEAALARWHALGDIRRTKRKRQGVDRAQ